MELHHRRADTHPGDDAFLGELEPSGIMRHVGRGAAHVEPDQLDLLAVGKVRAARRDHSDNAPGRPRQQGILAAKRRGIGQPAVRFHELQRGRAEAVGHPINVAREDRRQIGVDHRGIAARHQFDQRRDLVTDRDLRETEVARDGRESRLMIGEAPAVHQDDRDRVKTVRPECFEARLRRSLVE